MKADSIVKILLVDDRAENLFALEVILSNEHYLCVEAHSGEEALKILHREHGVALILMDVQMPKMDGFETVELIRQIERLKHIPIIFLTASMDAPVNIFKGYQSGAVDYMVKPLSPEILKAKVAVFVDLYKKTNELLIQKKQMTTLNSDVVYQRKIASELQEAKEVAEVAKFVAEEAKNKAEIATLIAENAVKAKQQFLSNMSHEIRTPMNAIIGFTKVMLKTDLTAKQKEYLTAIKMSGDSLIVLINDILDLAKVDAGKMTFERTPFKMALSLSAMIHLFEIKIQEKNLELVREYDSNIPSVLVGDPVRLHQIILNLVSNAVKFTSKGKITVSVRLLSEDDEKAILEFAVSDTGIGIPNEKLGKIFENFQQASSNTSRIYGGTGLGLAIAKQLVESQGGSITVKSKPEEGSTFSFILPFLKTKAETELKIEEKEVDIEVKNIKVLVVEDMVLNQLLMKTLLDDFGFVHEMAGNGKIAIEKLRNKPFDIILMDLQMPEMNGFEATEYIRNKMKSNIPIIALTADVTTADLTKCTAVGMNDYIAKPLDERLLFKKIINLIKKPMLVLGAENNKKIDIQTRSMPTCVDLAYLKKRTKDNPELMMEMIEIYLEQTPPLINVMKRSLHDKDWNSLGAAVHKMIPSFSIMGIHKDFENMARKIQEEIREQQHPEELQTLVLQLENVCSRACEELEGAFILIKETK
jgi:signal transduction histidine kinase/HPt (histidine-containing phosphotransfer) domain-containing protein